MITTKNKLKSLQELKKVLDTVFSEYIRLYYSDDNGQCTCVTCGETDNYKNLQNGHFIPRTHMGTRYEEKNCHPQCKKCNEMLRGNITRYKRFLVGNYGTSILLELELLKRAITHLTPYDMQEKIDFYRREVKRLKKEKGL